MTSRTCYRTLVHRYDATFCVKILSAKLKELVQGPCACQMIFMVSDSWVWYYLSREGKLLRKYRGREIITVKSLLVAKYHSTCLPGGQGNVGKYAAIS